MADSSAASSDVLRLKAAVVGASGVGKTTIVRAWAKRALPTTHVPTVGEDVVEIQEERRANAVLVVHDVGGNVTDEMAARSLADADAVVLVYDSTRREETLQVLSQVWIPRVKKHVGKNATQYLLETKARGLWPVCYYPELQLSRREKAVFHKLPRFTRQFLQVCELNGMEKVAATTLHHIFDHAYFSHFSLHKTQDKTSKSRSLGYACAQCQVS